MNKPSQIALGILIGAALIGCHGMSPKPGTASPMPPAAQPEPKSGGAALGPTATYTDSSLRFQYPANWKHIKGATAVLTVVAPPKSAAGGSATLFFDVPKVSSFEAALASPKAVADGYVNDTKKNRIPDAQVESKDTTVAGAAAKDVTLTGKQTGSGPGLPPVGSDATEEAIAVIHAGKIFIFSCDSDRAGTPAAHAALMAAVQSVQWTH